MVEEQQGSKFMVIEKNEHTFKGFMYVKSLVPCPFYVMLPPINTKRAGVFPFVFFLTSHTFDSPPHSWHLLQIKFIWFHLTRRLTHLVVVIFTS